MGSDASVAWAVVVIAGQLTLLVGVACWAHFGFRALREATAMQRSMLEALVAIKSMGLASIHQPMQQVEGGPFPEPLERDPISGSLIPPEDLG